MTINAIPLSHPLMVRFKYHPSFESFLALQYYHDRWKLLKVYIYGCAAMTLYFLLPLLPLGAAWPHQTLEIYREGWIFLMFPLLIPFMHAQLNFSANKRWRQNPSIRDAQEYELDENGIRVVTATLSNVADWRVIQKADLWKGQIYLDIGQNMYLYFPQSVLPPGREVLDLIARKTKVTDRWKRELDRLSSPAVS